MSSRTSSPVRQTIGAVMLMLLLGACSSTPPEPFAREETQEASATVEAINLDTRMISLRDADGRLFTVHVPPAARNLAQVNVGDRVVVRYQQALAAELRRRGDGTGETEAPVVETGFGRAAAGAKPGAVAGVETRQTVRITTVDTKNHVVGFYGSDGLARSLPVRSPQGQEFISKLKKGDEVELTYTEAMAVSVEPAN
jgi:hypothetical protein